MQKQKLKEKKAYVSPIFTEVNTWSDEKAQKMSAKARKRAYVKPSFHKYSQILNVYSYF